MRSQTGAWRGGRLAVRRAASEVALARNTTAQPGLTSTAVLSASIPTPLGTPPPPRPPRPPAPWGPIPHEQERGRVTSGPHRHWRHARAPSCSSAAETLRFLSHLQPHCHRALPPPPRQPLALAPFLLHLTSCFYFSRQRSHVLFHICLRLLPHPSTHQCFLFRNCLVVGPLTPFVIRSLCLCDTRGLRFLSEK